MKKGRVLQFAGFLLAGMVGGVGILLLLAVGPAAPQVSAVVRWETASEMETAGFNLYRSENPDGPFTQRVNTDLIPAGTTPLVGGAYVYTDTNVQPGRIYYYELEEVEIDGTRTRIGRIAVRVADAPWWWRLVGGALFIEALIVGRSVWQARQKERGAHE